MELRVRNGHFALSASPIPFMGKTGCMFKLQGGGSLCSQDWSREVGEAADLENFKKGRK